MENQPQADDADVDRMSATRIERSIEKDQAWMDEVKVEVDSKEKYE